MSFVKRLFMLLFVFIITVIFNTNNMNLFEKIDYELRRHLYIENIYYNFRSDIYSILKLDYKVSQEIVDNNLKIYKLNDRLVIESDNEMVINYQMGHVYSIDKSSNSVRISIDKDSIIEYKELSSIEVSLYDLVEVGDIVGMSKYDSYKNKYCYEIHVIKGDIDNIYEIML